MSKVLRVPAAGQAEAVAHFAARLALETDVSDVAADLGDGVTGFIVADSRSQESWDQGHVAGAIHLPTDEIATRAAEVIPPGATVVTYCWGPGCNGAHRAALEFAKLGYPVKEMIGGFEYWAREGYGVVDDSGPIERPIDELTAPVGVGMIDCAC